MTQMMIDKGEMDPKYKMVCSFLLYNFIKITLSMDGTHNLCKKIEGREDKMWSYKLKNIAYNILVIKN